MPHPRPSKDLFRSLFIRASLANYNTPFEDSLSGEDLCGLLAGFYPARTPIPRATVAAGSAETILFLARPRAHTGRLIPVDRGLTEEF